MRVIDNKEELLKVLSEQEEIKVYGARYHLRLFLEMLKILGYSSDCIKEILVSDMRVILNMSIIFRCMFTGKIISKREKNSFLL